LPFYKRAIVCAIGIALGVALILVAPWRPRYRLGLTVLGVLAALASLGLLLPGWTVARDNPFRRDPEAKARRRQRLRRAGRSWLGMSRWLLWFLGVLTGLWLVLMALSFLVPPSVPLLMLVLAFGLPLFFIGWIWLAVVGTQDGIPWWWFLPRSPYFSRRPLGWLSQYVRECPERAANPYWLALFGGLIFFATFGLSLIREKLLNRSPPAQQAGLAKGAAPAHSLFAKGPRVYLADLLEFDVKNGPWQFTKIGNVGDNLHPIQVNGVVSPKGLGMHPPNAPDWAAARYRLNKEAAVFRAAVALNDTANDMRSTAVFEVYGDGELLWRSKPVARPHRPQQCKVDVLGVDVLELRVRARGSYWGLHAVWVEPRLLQRAATPDRR
jgi:hypothetical protein